MEGLGSKVLEGGFYSIGGYIGGYYRCYEGDARSLDYSSCGAS